MIRIAISGRLLSFATPKRFTLCRSPNLVTSKDTTAAVHNHVSVTFAARLQRSRHFALGDAKANPLAPTRRRAPGEPMTP
jgi:hypothetical protein